MSDQHNLKPGYITLKGLVAWRHRSHQRATEFAKELSVADSNKCPWNYYYYGLVQNWTVFHHNNPGVEVREDPGKPRK